MPRNNVITDPTVRERWLMEGDHGDRCQLCGVPRNRSGWRGLVIHHIIHGCNARSDEPCNFLLVCGDCHDRIHDGQIRDGKTGELVPPITLVDVLAAKSKTSEWNPRRLEQLYHRRLPEVPGVAIAV